jgi:hypothetical protein
MPAEIRHLLFSENELLAALRTYSTTSGQSFPSGATATFENRDNPIVTATDPRDGKKLLFSGEKLTAALLLFCNRKKIPLPIRGIKALTILNGRITLLVKLSDGPE